MEVVVVVTVVVVVVERMSDSVGSLHMELVHE